MVKRLLGVLLVFSLLLDVLIGCVRADSRTSQEWYSDSADLSGWTIGDGVITGDFNAMVNKRIRQDCLTDMRNFVVEMDISSDKTSSPYIQILGVILELDGNNGTGEQVFVKLAGEMLEWFECDGTKVHVRIERVQGGELKFTLTGSGRNNTKTYTAIPTRADPGLEIGMYRGGKVVVSGLKVTIANHGDNKVPAMEYNRLVIPVTAGEHFEFCGAGNWRESNGWTAGVSTQEGIWIQSAEADGPNARAVYMTEKLSENWYTSMTFKPISTTNNGRTVCRVVFMEANRGAVMLLTMEHLAAEHKVKFGWQKNINGVWQDVWVDDDWTVAKDEAFTVTLQKQTDTQVALSIAGNSGYHKTVTKAVDSEVMARISRVGVSAERSTVRITNVVVTASTAQRDYTALAKQTYQNLVKNYVDINNKRIRPVRWGFHDGDVTNTGRTVHFTGVGDVWESTVMMMALHTYAQTLEKDGVEWEEVADIIANTINRLSSGYSEKQLTTATQGPNYAMDDCAWNVTGWLLGYYYNRELGYKSASAKCLSYAKALFNSSYDTFYTTELGGLAYTAKKEDVSLYGATMALAGYYLNIIEPDEKIERRFWDIYNGIENVLRRPDGLYWCGVTATGAQGAGNPYGINEAGSVSYIGGNMAMAVLNSLLGKRELAEQTVLGIVRYETYFNGAFLNDRDAWNNTFFMGAFVKEVIQKNIAGDIAQRALDATVSAILKNACFEDGYYSAAWLGPREPSSSGYPSQGSYSTDGRNNWGKQYNNNGLNIGSTPNQIMTSATTAHVLFAAALSASYERDIPADPVNPPGTTPPTEPMNSENPTAPVGTEGSAVATEPEEPDMTDSMATTIPSATTGPQHTMDTVPPRPTGDVKPSDAIESPHLSQMDSFEAGTMWFVWVVVVLAAVALAIKASRKKK